MNHAPTDHPSNTCDAETIIDGAQIATPGRVTTSLGYVLMALGLGTLLGFGRCFVTGSQTLSTAWASLSFSIDTLRAGSCVIALIVLAALSFLSRFHIGKTATIGASVLACVCSAICLGIEPTSDQLAALITVSSAIMGVAMALLMYVWAQMLSRQTLRVIVGVSLGGLICASAIIGVYQIVTAGVPQAGFALIAIASLACGPLAVAAQPHLESTANDGHATAQELRDLPWFTIIMVVATNALSMILYQALAHLYVSSEPTVSAPIFIGVSIIVIAATLAIIAVLDSWQRWVWAPLFVLLFCGLVLTCIVTWTIIPVIAALLYASVFCHHFLRWTILPSLVSQAHGPKTSICAVLLLVTDAGLWSSIAQGTVADLPLDLQTLGRLSGLMALVLLVLFVAAFMIMRVLRTPQSHEADAGAAGVQPAMESIVASADQTPDVTQNINDSDDNNDILSDNESIDVTFEHQTPISKDSMPEAATKADIEPETPETRLVALARAHDFTARELEIARLTAQGNTSNRIADILVISSSTVRFHQQNIYRKLDIHSRQEFIDLINNS